MLILLAIFCSNNTHFDTASTGYIDIILCVYPVPTSVLLVNFFAAKTALGLNGLY